MMLRIIFQAIHMELFHIPGYTSGVPSWCNSLAAHDETSILSVWGQLIRCWDQMQVSQAQGKPRSANSKIQKVLAENSNRNFSTICPGLIKILFPVVRG